MAILSEVRFAHQDGALAETLNTLPELEVTVMPDAQTDPDQRTYVIRFNNVDLDRVRRTLGSDHTVADIKEVPGFESQRLLGIQFSQNANLLNPKVAEMGGFVLEAMDSDPNSDPRGWHEQWLLPDGEAFNDVWAYAREAGFEFEVLDVRKHGQNGPDFAGAGSLTDEQSEALIVAYEEGYFAEPRETSLKELGDLFDLSPTAIGGRLRRGLRTLIGMTLLQSNQKHHQFEEEQE